MAKLSFTLAPYSSQLINKQILFRLGGKSLRIYYAIMKLPCR